jgi:sigma-54 specific flagellar transcriptional regulator A
MNCLARNPWPGNVRELSNLLERLAILFPGQTISAADLPERYRTNFQAQIPVLNDLPTAIDELRLGEDEDEECELVEAVEGLVDAPHVYEILEGHLPRGGIDLKDHLSAIEVGLIRKALVEADGTVAEAARLLRIRRTTLVEKLRKYRLSA